MQPTDHPNIDASPSAEHHPSSIPMVKMGEYVSNRELLRTFTDKHGCDFEVVSGEKQIVEVTTFRDCYEIILHPSQSMADVATADGSVPLRALYIPRAKRFSNSLVQVANGITFAKQNGINLLILTDFWYLPKGCMRIDDSFSILNMDKDSVTSIPGPMLSGLFFYQKSLRSLYPVKSEKRYHILQPLQQHLALQPSGPAFEKDELVIYIRSGDVFSRADGANPNYGQPPLAFYKLLLASIKWRKIHFVYENKANPIIAPLEDYLSQLGVKFDVQSGSLVEDLGYLMRAKSLVGARGTFISGVVSISPHIQNIFYFDKNYVDWGRGIQRLRILDVHGEYVKTNLTANWKNQPAQRQLMLDYPIEYLRADFSQF